MQENWRVCVDQDGKLDRVILVMEHGDLGETWTAWMYSRQYNTAVELPEYIPGEFESPHNRCESAAAEQAAVALATLTASTDVSDLMAFMRTSAVQAIRTACDEKGIAPPDEDWDQAPEAGNSEGDPK